MAQRGMSQKISDTKVLLFTQQEKKSACNEVLGVGALGLWEPTTLWCKPSEAFAAVGPYSRAADGGHVLSLTRRWYESH